MSFKCGFFVWHFFCLKGQHEKLQNLFFLEKLSSSLPWPDSNNTFEENRNLGNFSNSQVFGKFLGFPNFYRNLRVVYFQDFGNFSNDWIFHRFPCIWGIWQIPRYLRNSPDSKIFPDSLKNLRVFYFSTIGNREISQINREFPRFPSFWGTPQIPKLLGNFTNSQVFGEFPILTIF